MYQVTPPLLLFRKVLYIECHGIVMLGKSPINWRQHPDMTTPVDWEIKHQFKQIQTFLCQTKCSPAVPQK